MNLFPIIISVIGELEAKETRRLILSRWVESGSKLAAVVGKPNAAGFQHTPRPGDVVRLCADRKSAGQLLGFESGMTLHDGQPPEVLLEQESVSNWERKGRETDA